MKMKVEGAQRGLSESKRPSRSSRVLLPPREIRDDLNPQIYNRQYFRERLKDEIKRSNRHGHPFSLIIADVDHFKEVNDTHGHLVGDQTLTSVSQVFEESVRDLDVVCRYAGDEFTVILPEANQKEAKSIAERIRKGISGYPWERDLPFDILTMSVGIATYEKEESSTEIFVRADQAMYVAKKRGRNQVIAIESLTPSEQARKGPVMDLSAPILVGREKECLHLQRSFNKTLQGKGSILLIGGEAGSGKTSLVSSIERFPHFSQAFFLKGASHVETQKIPYYPFIEAITGYFQTWGKDQKQIYRQIPAVYRRELPKVIPQFEEREPKGRGEDLPPNRLRLFQGFHLVLETMSRMKPLVLFLDDLHWADETTLDLLHYIARRLGQERLLLLGTYRLEQLAKSPLENVIRSMEGERLLEKMYLNPLSRDAVYQLIDSAFPGQKVCGEFKKMVALKTGGNPFFVMEILRSLDEEDQVKVLEGGGSKESYEALALRASVQEMISHRMDELDPEILETLNYGAVLGNEFHIDLLLGLSGRNEGNLLDLLDKAVENYLIEEIPDSRGERYRFHHALIATGLYYRMSGRRKRFLHLRAGEVMEKHFSVKLDVVVGDLARHFFNGEDYSKAYLYAKKAGDQAKKIYANQEAIEFYTQAYAALDQSEKGNGKKVEAEFDLLLQRSEILGIVGRMEEKGKDVEKIAELSLTIKDQKRISDGYINQSYYYLQISDFPKSLKAAEKALEIKREIGDREGEAKALQRLGSVYTDMGNTSEAIKCHQRAVKICRETGDSTGEGANIFSIGVTCHFLGEFQRALKYYQDSLNIFKEQGDKWREELTLGNIGVINSQMGNYHKAIEFYNECLIISKELRDRGREGGQSINIGIALGHCGNYPEALEKFQEGLVIYQKIRNRAGEGDSLGNSGRVYTQLGNYTRALECLEKTLSIREEIGDRKGKGISLTNIGDVYESLGDHDNALEFQNRALAISKELNSKDLKVENLNSLSGIYTKKGGRKDLKLALQYAREAVKLSQEVSLPHGEIEGFSNQAIAHLGLGNASKALECSEKAVSLLERQKQMEGSEEEIYFNHFKILEKNDDEDNAKVFLKRAYDEVMKKANLLKDGKVRKEFLTSVRLNRAIVDTSEKYKIL